MAVADHEPAPYAGAASEKNNEKTPAGGDLNRARSYGDDEATAFAELAGTKRNVKSRHAQMIAIGGTIGTGLFVGSGQVLGVGGPGFLLLAYCLMSIFVYCIATAVIEVASYLPISGSSMSYYCNRYVSRSLGFALGWLYFYSFGILVAYEITAGVIVINYWTNNVHDAVWLTILIIVIVALNFSPVGVYAETEFWFASIKVIMICGLLVLSLILILGGGPSGQRLGFYYWVEPGATKEYIVTGDAGRFVAFLSTIIFSGFSFYFGPELITVTAGEMRNPTKNLPIAGRRYIYRLLFFYVFGSLAIGATCNPNAEGLTSGAGNANASPYVIAIRDAGIRALPSVVNAGILASAWSSGNSYLYMSSRSLYSLAVAGNAPKIFTRCNRYGLPVYAVIVSSLFSPLAYLILSADAGVVFNWFVNLTNTAGFTSWSVCAIIAIRFRKACRAQNITPRYLSRIQPYGAWIALCAFTFLLLANGYTVFFPGRFSASSFLTSYIGIPIFLVLFLGHKLLVGRGEAWLFPPGLVDLTTKRAEVEADAEVWAHLEAKDVERQGTAAWYLKVWWKIKLIWE
jgi:amino acid transporter